MIRKSGKDFIVRYLKPNETHLTIYELLVRATLEEVAIPLNKI